MLKSISNIGKPIYLTKAKVIFPSNVNAHDISALFLSTVEVNLLA